MNVPARGAGGSVHVVVESPRGATLKYKYSPEFAAVMLSRPLPAGLAYPYDWGFVPSTRAADGDPLDAFVVWDASSFPGVVIECRPIGVLKVSQQPQGRERERNDRLAVVPVKAVRLSGVRSVFDLPERSRQELEQFFVAAVAFEQKALQLLGWGGADEAAGLLDAAAP